MTPAEVAAVLSRRLVWLDSLRSDAAARGDLESVDVLDADIASTQQSLSLFEPKVD